MIRSTRTLPASGSNSVVMDDMVFAGTARGTEIFGDGFD
jgi:hypothetical protein